MRMSLLSGGAVAALTLAAPVASANQVDIASGQTSVALDFGTLEAAAGLAFNRVSSEVIAPGSIPGSVAFPINPRDASAPLLPTTFSYDTGDFLGTFSGAIEHEGSVFFDTMLGEVELGNFTIGFDAARVGGPSGTASGFFVASTAGLAATLFDIELVGAGPGVGFLTVDGVLLVSPELGQFLFDNGLAASNLEGAVVGSALVEGITDCSAVDINDNGRINGFDLFRYVRMLRRGQASADFNGDGVVDLRTDLLPYLLRFLECNDRRGMHRRVGRMQYRYGLNRDDD